MVTGQVENKDLHPSCFLVCHTLVCVCVCSADDVCPHWHQVKVMTEKELLGYACEQFLGKSVTEIKSVILQTLEGHLRAILGGSSFITILSLLYLPMKFGNRGGEIIKRQHSSDISLSQMKSAQKKEVTIWMNYCFHLFRHPDCWTDLPRQRQICHSGTRGGRTWCGPHGHRDP